MHVESFRTPGLGDQTYLLQHDGQGVLIDPQRDIERFLDAVSDAGVDLRFVLETHLHNDYVSGAEQVAVRTGAELVMPAGAAPAYRHTPAFHHEDIDGGRGLSVRPIHTPGHTPEHTSYVVYVDGEPVALFSGGSLLVQTAGRPDLLGPERAETLARLQYQSIQRLAGLPRGLALYPTHGAGSFCTASGAGRLTSTVGDEVDTNPLLQLPSADDMVEQMLGSPMPIPGFYRYMSPANTFGVKPLPQADVPLISVAELRERRDVHIVDIRPRDVQAAGMLPGTVGVELGDDFGSWAGWIVPYNDPVVLVADPTQDIAAAITQLHQIQFDNIVGVVTDLGDAELSTTVAVVDLAGARELLERGVQLLDARMPREWDDEPYDGPAVQRFAADVYTRGIPSELDRDKPVLVGCKSGRRAMIAATRLADAGYAVYSLNAAGIPDLKP